MTWKRGNPLLKKLEAMGAGLLERFVPGIEASAAQCGCKWFKACWQCPSNQQCKAYCCDGQGCVVKSTWCGATSC
ncbi:hypothetical protein ACFVZR_23190 [Streptomyces sp. NPDC058316]|uniref:hypothetical protein n=1 Tax=unclassified Streptomyces TaxID=2593676 RepID=UPI00332AB993